MKKSELNKLIQEEVKSHLLKENLLNTFVQKISKMIMKLSGYNLSDEDRDRLRNELIKMANKI